MRAIGIALTVVLALGGSFAFADPYEVGVHYERLPIAVDTADPSKIEVVEVFSYGCPHCFSFEPAIEAWRARQPADVDFRRIPAVFRSDWKILAQAYYAAEVLGVVDKVHEPIFDAIHVQGLNAGDPAVLAKIFQDSAGIDGEQFLKVLNSFGVTSKVQQADAQARMYRVPGVPTLIVNGKYRVNGGQLVGTNVEMLDVVDYLVAKERDARKHTDAGAAH
jgi:protein dithiol oxidoreductase (disulfide-forming)